MATKVKLIETGAVTGNIIPDGGIATGKLANDAVTTIKISDANITHAKLHTSMDLTGKTVTVATAAGSTNTTAAASTAFVQQELTTLIGGAPSTLNDLNELAAAINDDANYNSTLTTALATKLPLAGGTMTGDIFINGGSTTERNVRIQNTDNVLYAGVEGSSGNRFVGSAAGNAFFGTTSDSGLEFATHNNVRMVVDGDGNVGIGTTSPLSLDGNAAPGLTVSSNGPYILLQDANNSDKVRYISNNTGEFQFGIVGDNGISGKTEHMRIDTSGNVGIGTDAPDSPLEISGADDTRLKLTDTGDSSELMLRSDGVNTQIYTNTAHDLGIYTTGNLGQLHLKQSNGNVGIGVTNPTTALHVNGAISLDYGTGVSYQGIKRTSVGNEYYVGTTSTGTHEIHTFTGSSAAKKMVILENGNVGIGTPNPGAKLEISGFSTGAGLKLNYGNSNGTIEAINFKANGGANGVIGMQMVSAGVGDLWLGGSGGRSLTLYRDGNVGIGTTNPNLPLTVTSNSGANALAIRARSADDYGFMQFYNHAGDTVRGQVYSHSTGNAVGISTGNSSSNGIKIDTDGLHFQKADGQKISAKESIVMQVDADNNTSNRVFSVTHGNGKTLLNLYDDYRTDVGTLQYNSSRSAGATVQGSFSSSAGDWVDVATIPYGRNIATIKFWWDGLSAPGSAHHGLMEFDIGSHYGTSYYYGWDSYINLKTSSAHNSFYISEARIITPGGSGATGYFQVKFAVAVSTGTFRAYVTTRDESCSITPMTPAVNNSRSGTTIAELKLGTDQGLVRNRVGMATSRDMHIGGGLTIVGQTSFNAYSPAVTSTNSTVVFGSTRHNVGSGYSTSTGKFTASTAGKYFFTFDVLMNSTANANYGRVLFRVNNVGNSMEQYGDSLTYQSTGQSYFGLGLTCLISLNVGDYVEVYNAGQWPTYGTQYGVFCGHLLG